MTNRRDCSSAPVRAGMARAHDARLRHEPSSWPPSRVRRARCPPRASQAKRPLSRLLRRCSRYSPSAARRGRMIPGRPAASHFTGSSRCFLCSRWIVPACARAGIGSHEGLRRACRDGGAEGVVGVAWSVAHLGDPKGPILRDLGTSRRAPSRAGRPRGACHPNARASVRGSSDARPRRVSTSYSFRARRLARSCTARAPPHPRPRPAPRPARAGVASFPSGFDFQIWQVNPPLRACCTAAQWRAGAQRPEGVQQTMIEQMTVQVMSGSCRGGKLVANYSVPSGQ